MPSLNGKIALITGASSGIGFGIAEHFASIGAAVVVHARTVEDGAAAVERLRQHGYDATSTAADLRDVDACRQTVRTAIAWRGA